MTVALGRRHPAVRPGQRADPGCMTNVLVCIKRVPDSSGEVLLTDDAQAVDGRYVGFTVEHPRGAAPSSWPSRSPTATGGAATVLTLGAGRRGRAAALRAVAVGCTAATLVEADSVALRPGRRRPRDRRRGRERTRPRAAPTTWSCSATTPPTAATSRSASGSPTSSAGRSSAGIATVEVAGRRGHRRGARVPTAHETFELPLPGGGHRARGRRRAALPDGAGADEGQEDAPSRSARPTAEPAGPKRVRLTLPPPTPSEVQVLGEGAARRPPCVDLLASAGGGPMILVLVETDAAGVDRGLPRDADLRPRARRGRRRRADRRAGRRRRAGRDLVAELGGVRRPRGAPRTGRRRLRGVLRRRPGRPPSRRCSRPRARSW